MVGFNLTVAITGASGAVFGRELLRTLEPDRSELLTTPCVDLRPAP